MATMIVLPHMAQLLVCAVPNPGHVFPMMTVSRHLRAAGHKIIFYTAEIFRSKVESCGSSFVSLPGKANKTTFAQMSTIPKEIPFRLAVLNG